MDTIFISELRVEARIGIYAWEHEVAQTIELNLEFAIDAARSASSGDIADTVDYAAVVARIRALLAAQHYTLLELLAEKIAATIMQEYGVPWVRLSIAKLGALPGVRKLGISIERGSRA